MIFKEGRLEVPEEWLPVIKEMAEWVDETKDREFEVIRNLWWEVHPGEGPSLSRMKRETELAIETMEEVIEYWGASGAGSRDLSEEFEEFLDDVFDYYVTKTSDDKPAEIPIPVVNMMEEESEQGYKTYLLVDMYTLDAIVFSDRVELRVIKGELSRLKSSLDLSPMWPEWSISTPMEDRSAQGIQKAKQRLALELSEAISNAISEFRHMVRAIEDVNMEVPEEKYGGYFAARNKFVKAFRFPHTTISGFSTKDGNFSMRPGSTLEILVELPFDKGSLQRFVESGEHIGGPPSGLYDSELKTIMMNPISSSSLRELYSTLRHEVMHAIQYGLRPGDNFGLPSSRDPHLSRSSFKKKRKGEGHSANYKKNYWTSNIEFYPHIDSAIGRFMAKIDKRTSYGRKKISMQEVMQEVRESLAEDFFFKKLKDQKPSFYRKAVRAFLAGAVEEYRRAAAS